MSTEYLVYAILSIGFFTGYMALVNLFRSDQFRKRVKTVAGGVFEGEGESSVGGFSEFCEQLATRFPMPEEKRKKLSQLLMYAGIQSPHAISYIIFYNRIIQPILLAAALMLWVRIFTAEDLSNFGKIQNIFLSIVLYIAARSGVDMYIKRRRKQRQRILLRYFPEVLDLLLVCIESGLGLDAALARASRELDVMHPVIVAELDRTRLELTLLSDRVQALQNLADRTEIVAYKALVAALIQTERFGTSLVDTLRVLAEDQRVTRLLETENRVARIPALITIPLILCILPSFMIILVGPPLVSVIDGGGLQINAPSPQERAKAASEKRSKAAEEAKQKSSD
jgi:tight adherence protein C